MEPGIELLASLPGQRERQDWRSQAEHLAEHLARARCSSSTSSQKPGNAPGRNPATSSAGRRTAPTGKARNTTQEDPRPRSSAERNAGAIAGEQDREGEGRRPSAARVRRYAPGCSQSSPCSASPARGSGLLRARPCSFHPALAGRQVERRGLSILPPLRRQGWMGQPQAPREE